MTFYLRCAFCEMVMAVTGPVMDALDRIGLGRTRLYGLIDKPYDMAWQWMENARDASLVDSPASGTIRR
jgi:hypothetical protein